MGRANEKNYNYFDCFFALITFNNPLYAKEQSICDDDYYTCEPSIPINESERKEWINEVAKYNQKLLNQEFEKYEENDKSYIFYFKRLCNPIYLKQTDEIYYGVEKIEYLKPENEFNIVVRDGVQYDSKFTYYYGASGRYIQIDHENASLLMNIIDSLIKIASSVNGVVGEIFSSMLNVAKTMLDLQRPAELTTYNQYFYYNKVCSVKTTTSSTWYPTCQIGKRYSHTKEVGSVYINGGYLRETTTYLHQWDGVTVPPLVPSQAIEKKTKSHYNDNAWMINKAIEYMYNGGYVDVFGIAIYVAP